MSKQTSGSSGNTSPVKTNHNMAYQHGHSFIKKTFHKPTNCHYCSELLCLWSLMGQGYICEVCNFIVHEKCLKTVSLPCVSVAATLVKNPVAHVWSERTLIKRRFCNVCRKKIEDIMGFCCEVCDYYLHETCYEFAVPNCLESATYDPAKSLQDISRNQHHFQEGNLPPNSKCMKCKRACWSQDFLTGMRCQWCGLTGHSSCLSSMTPCQSICQFGSLGPIFLPPSAISIPRTQLAQHNAVPIKGKDSSAALMQAPIRTSISDDWSSTGFMEAAAELEINAPDKEKFKEKRDKERQKERAKVEKEKENEDETIKVYDGYNSLRKRLFRTVTVNKNCSKDELLLAAMRAFVVTQDSRNFYLLDVYANYDGDRDEEIEDPYPVQRLKRKEGKRPAILIGLRDNENDSGVIKVWARKLQVSPPSLTIPVSGNITTEQVIKEALCRFRLESEETDTYQLVKVTVEAGRVTETVLSSDDIPWEVLKRRGHEAVRLMELTRFYLEMRKDPHGPDVALFVGNLPANLSHKQYETILLEFLDDGNRFTFIGPIYYEYGSMVITFDSSNTAVYAYQVLRASSYEDKKLLVMMLPSIKPSMMSSSVCPLLVFVNVKSGGGQGLQLIQSFRKLLNPHQVFDLCNGGPLCGLYVFRKMEKYKILVCGGDGTIGWVLQCLDNVGQDSQCSTPPCAIVPLGTGNDLARVLRWGPGYTGTEDPLTLLRDVIDADEVRLDRWTVVFRPNTEDMTGPDGQSLIVSNAQTSEDNAQIFVMNNYFGIGLDADLCLDFHNKREENPEKFNSRFHNKGVYVKVGLRKMVGRRSCKDLNKEVTMEVDGKLVDLPNLEGIIILNIMSWGSGANAWGIEVNEKFTKPNHWDGVLEVVGVTGVVHLGQIQSGLRSAIRIVQGSHIKIKMNSEIPVQVDGEPWIQPSGDIVVLKSALKATMLKKSKMKRRNAESGSVRQSSYSHGVSDSKETSWT
ncbi:diacylglycerol kinase theta isoform X2 [Lepeophtheirus salmonis]|uniref:Diacylglycerol kinase n=1 Tax=Lepeophtheirus salmonis TaxID=72036 RepID=A0A0K2TVQ2_LEPSM|nr:diacylglycerol kinase theta-like isoform X2 [Lepeophtheirus salmonis]